MIRGAASLARRLGVSPTVIGLTVVAFGTSSPELAVNVAAALKAGEISFGNIVGSNLANIGLGIGLAALVTQIPVESVVSSREIPMMLLATVAALVAGLDQYLSASPPLYSRTEAILLLLFFLIFLYYNLSEVVRGRRDEVSSYEGTSVALALVLFAVGLAGLVGGAELTVRAAVRLAEEVGVPKSFIGFTLIALGTSLPEIATSLIAVKRGEKELLVGNIVGSNIFNLLFILGTTAAIKPVPVPSHGIRDLVVLLLMCVFFWRASSSGKLTKASGLLLLASYLIYVGFKGIELSY